MTRNKQYNIGEELPLELRLQVYQEALDHIKSLPGSNRFGLKDECGLCLLLPCILYNQHHYLDKQPNGKIWEFRNTPLHFSKVTKIDDDEESVMNYFTPYQNVSVEIGKEYNGKLDPPYREIEIGFHSYKYFSDCKQDQCYNEVIVRCIIPKGSKYYEGVFGLSPSYASNAIKYVEIVPF